MPRNSFFCSIGGIWCYLIDFAHRYISVCLCVCVRLCILFTWLVAVKSEVRQFCIKRVACINCSDADRPNPLTAQRLHKERWISLTSQKGNSHSIWTSSVPTRIGRLFCDTTDFAIDVSERIHFQRPSVTKRAHLCYSWASCELMSIVDRRYRDQLSGCYDDPICYSIEYSAKSLKWFACGTSKACVCQANGSREHRCHLISSTNRSQRYTHLHFVPDGSKTTRRNPERTLVDY